MNRLIQHWHRDDAGNAHPCIIKCDCECVLEGYRPGGDVGCDRCGREYNSSGQLLADRSQWGEESGEHPAEIAQAFIGGEP